MPPTQLRSSDGNHEPTPWPRGCWWCQCAPHMGTHTPQPPPPPRGHHSAWLYCKASCRSSRRVLGSGGGALSPWALRPSWAPSGAALLPALPKRHRLVPAAGSPGPGRARGARAPARQPSSPPLPSGGWLPPAGRLGEVGGGPRCAPSSLPRRHVRQPAPARHQAALALLFLGPMAAALAWPRWRGQHGDGGGPVPVPSPGCRCARGWAGVRGQGTGAANNSSPPGRYFSGRSGPAPPARLPGVMGTVTPLPTPISLLRHHRGA